MSHPATTALAEISPDQLRLFLEHTDLAIWEYDTTTGAFSVSDAWRRMRGLKLTDTFNKNDESWLDEVHPDDRDSLRNLFNAQTRGEQEDIRIQYRRRHTSGHWVWILCQARVMQVDSSNMPLRIMGSDTDITVVKQTETDLMQLNSKLQLAIEASGMGIWEFNPVTRKVHWDDRMLQIYGVTDGKNDRSGDSWETYLHPDDLDETIAYAENCHRNNLDFAKDYRIVRPDGAIQHVRSLARYVKNATADAKLIGVNIDVTDDYLRTAELEQARRQLEFDSRHDALTGLANRRMLDETIAALRETSDTTVYAVMHLDLDHFKKVNDTLGHAAGDLVLKTLTKRLSQIIGDRGLACRVGGDEFVVLFCDAPDTETLQKLSTEIITSFKKPIRYEGHSCAVGVSIGIATGRGSQNTPQEVFRNADVALYAAKDGGRSCVEVYSPSIRRNARVIADTRQRLLDALARNEIICHYQPQFDPKTHSVIGAEALVRWECPEQGMIVPEEFVPLAVETGMIASIDAAVFHQVIAQQSAWHDAGVAFPPIALNISEDRLSDPNLLSEVRSCLRPFHLLSFELLETAFLDETEGSKLAQIESLRDLGIKIALDDFGSGHASIVALQNVRPDHVKIDRRLVQPINAHPNQLLLLQSIAAIARLSGCRIVMEGLETHVHLAAISNVDCDALQGHALGQPLPAEDFTALLLEQKGRRVVSSSE
ncbi:diguanylate cyclase/phosphodiesterase with PAS/PAC sensor(s) [Cognatiyoonia koreensis]|uniref:Diguanylate cyclase/phosphodiesterase with PAS/PAC sensor(S) n=1 Tax=Cognatiyoonia koreensis TaxID=364200 RepID=A0A1I0RTW4_9RHOB|nr:GGDEF and EAL domain-containing protein [Cognatiyoonia koreensis]SEW44646.1 diguanylate cyclase/phosphodiesterase with PAS/PAC sensor(s) [Cognatiyoonia koreensis]